MTNKVLAKRLHSNAIYALPLPAIAARNDFDAASIVKCSWSPHTTESNHRKAARLLTSLGDEGLTLTQLNAEDVYRYFEHLVSQPPHWSWQRKAKSNERPQPTQLVQGGLFAKELSDSANMPYECNSPPHVRGFIRDVVRRAWSCIEETRALTRR